jgi:hypothetical protein
VTGHVSDYATSQALTSNPRWSDNLSDMVNSEFRAKAASQIRVYLEGKIDNFEFADDFPRDKTDPALKAIEDRLWFHYDDVRPHHCEFPLHSDTEMLFRRCALFLDTKLEYEWPKLWHHDLAHPIIRILSGQFFRSNAIERAKSAGDYAVWPFFRKVDLEKARAECGPGNVTPDVESPEPPLSRHDRIMLRILRGIDYVLAGLFLAAVSGFLWGVIGHGMGMAASLICVLAYLLVLGGRQLILKVMTGSHSDRLNASSPG